nr:acetate--CoA ligase family protein [Seohaeicola saemankumensis]
MIGGGTWCANVIAECHKIGFSGPIWVVHPTRDQVAGLPAFARVAALPDVPDASFIGVNRRATIEAVRALAERGAGGAVCFAAGFRESEAETGDGTSLQAELVAAAGDMRVLGPNCYGFINALDGVALWPDQHGTVAVDRGVAIVTQSSNIAINLTMQQRGLPLAYVVTAGNQAQTGLAEIGRALLEDDRVNALGLYIEGIGDLRQFETLAKASLRLGKPVVALKVGGSHQARAATVSHTASLVGSATGARALFDRLGIGQVDSLAELLEVLKLLHVCGPLTSNRIASMSCSGGEAALMADVADAKGLDFPELTPSQRQKLRAELGSQVALANPLDYNTYIWGDRTAMARCFAAMMSPGLSIGCIILDFPRRDRCDDSAWAVVLDAAQDCMHATEVSMAIVSTLPETLPESVAEAAMARGLVPLAGLPEALAAIAVAARLGRDMADRAPVILPGTEPANQRVWSEAQAKSALSAKGIKVPHLARASNPQEAARRAGQIGFPAVLKGEGLAHKSETGAVVLGLTNTADVRKAAERMAVDSYLVEQQVTGSVAELLVGVLRDPAHGFVLTLGAGGVLTELMADSVSLLLPVTDADLRQALNTLRIAPLLHGYRGAPAADFEGIISAILAVQDFVTENASNLAELEVNPLICTQTGAIAVDALIRMGEPE